MIKRPFEIPATPAAMTAPAPATPPEPPASVHPLHAPPDSPLPPAVARERLHQRRITLDGFRRADGLWDIEGHLVDVKDYDFSSVSRPMPAGTPIHDMWLRITVDRSLTIVDAAARMAARPYAGHCEQIEPDYRKLIGLRIAPGFTNAVRTLLGGRAGCTHLTELVSSLATTAFQTLAGERNALPPDVRPPHLDRCHALDTRGPVVREFYPRWYQTGQTGSDQDAG